jgi:hypothetical protein
LGRISDMQRSSALLLKRNSCAFSCTGWWHIKLMISLDVPLSSMCRCMIHCVPAYHEQCACQASCCTSVSLCVMCNMLALRNSFLHVRMLVSFLRMNCKALLEQEGMLVSFEQAHGAKPSALPHHQKSFNGSALVPFVHLSVVHVHCNMCVCAHRLLNTFCIMLRLSSVQLISVASVHLILV